MRCNRKQGHFHSSRLPANRQTRLMVTQALYALRDLLNPYEV